MLQVHNFGSIFGLSNLLWRLGLSLLLFGPRLCYMSCMFRTIQGKIIEIHVLHFFEISFYF